VPVLTIASSKGGPGKITITMLLAGRLAADGLRVVALDADPSLAFSRWAHNAYEGPPFTARGEADETRLAHLIGTESQTADLVLVDTAGFGNLAADVAMTVPAIRLVIGLARASRRDIPACVLLNRVRRTQLARHAADEIAAAGLAPPGCHLFRPRRLWRDQPFRAHSNARRGSRGARPSARRTGGARLGWVPRQGVLT
jgi:chromosome partitioning protein